MTPVFEDNRSFSRLCRQLSEIGTATRLEILAVDDGSVADAPDLESIAAAGLTGRVIRLRRNCGHQMAILVGLVCAAADPRYDGVVVMDSDGEDRPEDVARLIETVADGCDAAVARRGRRTETLVFRVFYFIYRMLFRLCTGHAIRSGNFCALSRRAVLRLTAMQETRFHLAAAVMKSRLRQREIRLDRGHRYHGRSRMKFISLVLHGIRAIAVFDDAVLIRVGAVCVGAAVSGAAAFAAAGMLKLIGEASPGWLTIVSGFMVVVFLQTAILSMVALMMSGLGQRSPAEVEAGARSLIAERQSNVTGDRDDA